jgi:hypothetical protein
MDAERIRALRQRRRSYEQRVRRRGLQRVRALLARLLRRRPVVAGGRPEHPDDGGTTGVREPRGPRPVGPQAGAGARELPRAEQAVRLPDPRQ